MMKGQIRSRQLAAARNRMMADVPQADVVLVNPTHVAVALRYDPAKGTPRVVAKGAGVVAARIRELAETSKVADGRGHPAGPGAVHRLRGRPGDPAAALRGRRPGARVRAQPARHRRPRRHGTAARAPGSSRCPTCPAPAAGVRPVPVDSSGLAPAGR